MHSFAFNDKEILEFDDHNSEDIFKGKDNKKAANDLLKAYKLKAFDDLVKNVSVESEPNVDISRNFDEVYLDREQKKILEESKCLIRGHSTFKLRWDVLIMILAIFNCFAIPFEVAFGPPIMHSLWFLLLDTAIDLCFAVDLVVNFRTSFIHPKTGHEVLSGEKIALAYLKGRFWIDLLATIPFDNIAEAIVGSGNASLLSIFSLMKLVRVLRLNRIIALMKVANEVKLSLKLGKLIFFLVMYLHCCGCAWYYIVSRDKKWIPPLDYVFITTNFYDEGIDHRYFSSIYHAVLMLTGNDLGPREIPQIIFVSVTLTAGAIINANIFGELAVILASLNRKATAFQAKLDTANAAMKTLGLDEKVQVQITGFLTYSKALLESQEELQAFLAMISPSLRHRVLKHMFSGTLITNPVFNGNIEMVEFMSKRFETQILLPEFSVITQGEQGNDLYALARGECTVLVTDHKGNTQTMDHLLPGDIFGEIALLCDCTRTATVKTYIYSTVAKLTKTHFNTICSVYTWFQEKLKKLMKGYKDNLRVFSIKLIQSIDYMNDLSAITLEEISYHLEQEHFEQNKVIFRAGEPIDRIYFIVNGIVNISVNVLEREIIIDSISQG